MWLCVPFHQVVKSISHWSEPCDLLWTIKYDRSDNVPVPSLRILSCFHSPLEPTQPPRAQTRLVCSGMRNHLEQRQAISFEAILDQSSSVKEYPATYARRNPIKTRRSTQLSPAQIFEKQNCELKKKKRLLLFYIIKFWGSLLYSNANW